MSATDLWPRLRKARLTRVLIVYLAASWLILQVAALLREELGLPSWLTPAVLLLLLGGLVVVGATAWVQSHPHADARAEREEVPGAWEIDLDDARQSLSRGRVPHLTWARVLAGGGAALLLLVLVAGTALLIRGGDRRLAPEEALAAAAPGIAVLPFSVSGQGLEQWREGMVDLLSTNLDGLAGLRTIDSRTVLSRWGREIPVGTTPDLPLALGVARGTGARYALTGSAVASGRGMRLVADVYDLRTAEELGQVQVEGSPDSVFTLVDRLSIEVLRTLLQDSDRPLPSVDLARITTTSLPALKAFLEGEALFRRSDFQAAIAPYQRAVDSDSTFALALYRLSFSYAWAENIASERAHEFARQAVRHAQRLPERESLLVRGLLALQLAQPHGVELLRQAVQKYPDDPEAWFLLGDTYHHLGGQLLLPAPEAEKAFQRAIDLDPSFTPAYIHLMEAAVWLHADSARAARLTAAYAKLAPTSEFLTRTRLALDLAFGRAEVRERALAVFDTAATLTLRGLHPYLGNPRFLSLVEELAELARRNPDNPNPAAATEALFWAYWGSGKLRAALELLGDAAASDDLVPQGTYLLVHDRYLRVPAEHVERALQLAAADTALGRPTYYGALLAADLERWTEHTALVSRFREARLSEAAIDTTEARVLASAVRTLDAYRAWHEGRAELALTAFRREQGKAVPFDADLRWWIAEILLQLEPPGDALPYLQSFELNARSLEKLAPLYEERGEYAAARDAWELVAIAWRDADPELRPRAEAARAAARRLTSAIRE